MRELLEKRLEKSRQLFSPCRLCPRVCRKKRLEGEIGECGIGKDALVSSYGPHFGEEPVLVGRKGSGTVFFSGCNLRCVYCQNYEISQYVSGFKLDSKNLAYLFLKIQEMGCHNLNLVTPSHVVHQVLEALLIAKDLGLSIPVVYNTSGYDSIQALKLLDGLVDIYMPDFKYSDDNMARKYSFAPNYPQVAKKAIKEMHKQVGDLVVENGIAKRGLLIRHLVLPNNIAGSKEVIDFIVDEISPNTYLNVMDQYYPTYRAYHYSELSRRITKEEYFQVVEYAQKRGIKRGIPFDYL